MELTHLFQLNTVWLRAVLQDGPVADLSKRFSLSFSRHELCEVWLIPENEPAYSPEFLEKATVNSVEELFSLFNPADARSRDGAYVLQQKLLEKNRFFLNLPYSETTWHYSILATANGPVISIVFGNYRAMNKMYAANLRSLPASEIDQ